MANHPSAEKRNRQNLKRHERNTHTRTVVRTLVKRVRVALETGNAKEAKTALAVAVRRIDQAVSKGVFHASTGARYVSRLMSQVAALGKAA